MDAPENYLETLRRVNVPSLRIEDFRPFSDCLESRLADAYWMTQGTRGFMEESVPYSVTSGGSLSRDAAELLFANCLEFPPTERFAVLELCAGSGLFARHFIDGFRRLCAENNADFHTRMVYYCTDRSPATVAQWKELGVLEGLPAVMARGDAMTPLQWETADGPVEFAELRAVFCNYGLDSLPAAIVRQGPNGPEELCVRTNLTPSEARRKRLQAPPLEELRAMAERTDITLAGLAPLLESEIAFRPCTAEYPFLREALEWYPVSSRVLLNYGAFVCLRQLIQVLNPNGFILINDFGIVDDNAPVSNTAAQRYGSSQAHGLHFPMLARVVPMLGAEVIAPVRPVSSLHPRLLIRRELPATLALFQQRFGIPEWQTAIDDARAHVRAGAFDDAKAAYEAALSASPRDWSILGEVAEFLLRQLREPVPALELIRGALALNPWYSTWLWNVYGDTLYALERFGEALGAFKIAEEKAPRDVRTLVNLSYAYSAMGNRESALVAIARGFANDADGAYRERLREKQNQILTDVRSEFLDAKKAREEKARRLVAD